MDSISTNGLKTPEADVNGTSDTKKEEDGIINAKPLRKVAILSSKASSGYRCVEDYDAAELRAIEIAVREGRSKLTEAQHTRCANISVVRYESATNTDLLVSSFNINTNKWMLE